MGWTLLPVLVACNAVIAGGVGIAVVLRDRNRPRHRAEAELARPQRRAA